VLYNVAFRKEVELEKKIAALGGKFQHIRNIVEETSIAWKDTYIDLLEIEDLFGMSAEKIAEAIVTQVNNVDSS
jgi:glucosamine--fructose-6-phosphate aminotransferase (isomerizing)